MINITSTLIITTYNWPEALELVLLSIQNQMILPSEVIIADDGSKEETKSLITSFQENFPVPLIHVWHKDDGFRLAQIRNKAINKATSEYIIQIDGDIILHPNFIKNHLQIAKTKTFLTGSRVWLNEVTSKQSQKTKNIKFNWLSKGVKNRLNAMYIPFLSPFLLKPTYNIAQAIEGVRGCNMSFWKKDLIAVNGYDEDMIGWGREDSEISVRLVNSGIKKERIKFGAIQYHQYHPMNSRSGLNKNEEVLKETVQQKRKRCKNGLTSYD